MTGWIRAEPAVFGGLVLAVVQNVVALLVVFGVDLTEAQTAAILGVSGAVLALATSFVVRANVKPTAPKL